MASAREVFREKRERRPKNAKKKWVTKPKYYFVMALHRTGRGGHFTINGEVNLYELSTGGD